MGGNHFRVIFAGEPRRSSIAEEIRRLEHAATLGAGG